MADCNFLQKAITIVTQATEADIKKDYAEAFRLYQLALEYFMTALKYEKNERCKQTIRAKLKEYINRAEKLKTFLTKMEGSKSGPEQRLGDEDEQGDPEETKLQQDLQRAVKKPNVCWGNVAGLECAKEFLKDAVILPIKFPQLFTGLRQRKSWKSILLYGPPGTGKSYLAEAVATEANLAFFSVNVMDLWLSKSKRPVRSLFNVARRNKPSIIFIDELDLLCSLCSKGEEACKIKAEFLIEMDGIEDDDGVLVLGATNIPWQLDAAIRRWFEKRIYIGLPEAETRARIFQIHLSNMPHNLTHQDFLELGDLTECFSGSDILACVRYALMKRMRVILNGYHFNKPLQSAHNNLGVMAVGSDSAWDMTWIHERIPEETLFEHVVTMQDFLEYLRNSKPTVNQAELQKQAKFTEDFGQGN